MTHIHIIRTEEEKKRDRLINSIKKAVEELKRMDYKIKIDQDVETMTGNTLNHVYLYDTVGTRVILQKHLFSY